MNHLIVLLGVVITTVSGIWCVTQLAEIYQHVVYAWWDGDLSDFIVAAISATVGTGILMVLFSLSSFGILCLVSGVL